MRRAALALAVALLCAAPAARAAPTVLIYGDSIAMGYTPVVRALLRGDAVVLDPGVNGGASVSIVGKLRQFEGRRLDLVLINAGLHDLTDSSTGENAYRAALDEAWGYLHATHPDARMAWVTTTPQCGADSRRPEARIAEYNAAALEVLPVGAAVVDLHAYTEPYCREWRKNPTNIHYNETGKRAQGAFIAAAIRLLLEVE